MTATDPTAAPARPATPGQAPDGPEHWHVTVCVHEQLTDSQRDELFSAVADAAHEVDDRWSENELGPDVLVTGAPCRCLDAAPAADPAVYRLPTEPPDGTRLKDRGGGIWERDGTKFAPWLLVRNFRGEPPSAPVRRHWHDLLAIGGPLSTAPPAGTEAQ